MNTTTSKQLLDTAGSTHTIALDPAGITLDGKPCRLVVKDTQVDLLSLDPALGVISVAPAALWHAFAGGDPTAEDAGLIQAHALAHWSAMQEIAELTGRLRPILDDIDRRVHQHSKPPLPFYRFSSFVSQILATLDGTEEQTLAVARILKQSPQTICDWGAQMGKNVSLPLADQQSQQPPLSEKQANEQPVACVSTAESEEGGEPTGGSRRGKRGFPWTEEHERLLAEAYDTSQQSSINARMKEIAARFGWSFHVVDYRLRQLLKNRQKPQREATEQLLPTEPPHQKFGPETLRCAQDDKATEPPHQEDDRVEVQPITALSEKVDMEQSSPVSLPSGPFLWDVRIDGKLQRWQLESAYGQFPQQAGTHFVYREREYVLLRASHSTIVVTPVESAVQEPSPERQLAAV
jgi:hypothetical protein